MENVTYQPIIKCAINGLFSVIFGVLVTIIASCPTLNRLIGGYRTLQTILEHEIEIGIDIEIYYVQH